MFTSDQEPNPESVEEFQLPAFKGEEKALVKPLEFQPWDIDLGEGDFPGGRGRGAAKADEIVAAAHLKAQEIEQQAYEEGFQQGQHDGVEVGRRALEEVVKRLQNLVTSLEQDRESLFQQREGILVELVMLVSEKLLARELRLHPETIRQIIEAGFQQVAHQEGLRLLVSSLDYEVLRQENLEAWPSGVELVADGTLSPGGFRLETALGEVDGTRETRWDLVIKAVQLAVEAMHAPAAD
jgi:flagellar biosynthesis/type III secretory pathway protein FliH